jgi:hypothetical protein
VTGRREKAGNGRREEAAEETNLRVNVRPSICCVTVVANVPMATLPPWRI